MEDFEENGYLLFELEKAIDTIMAMCFCKEELLKR